MISSKSVFSRRLTKHSLWLTQSFVDPRYEMNTCLGPVTLKTDRATWAFLKSKCHMELIRGDVKIPHIGTAKTCREMLVSRCLKPLFHWNWGSRWLPNANEIYTKKRNIHGQRDMRLGPNATYIPLAHVGVIQRKIYQHVGIFCVW